MKWKLEVLKTIHALSNFLLFDGCNLVKIKKKLLLYPQCRNSIKKMRPCKNKSCINYKKMFIVVKTFYQNTLKRFPLTISRCYQLIIIYPVSRIS